MPRRVLIVEDESLLVMVLEDVLPALGCEVAATAHSVETALAALAADDAVDLAILDVNLAGDDSFPVADALSARGIPFFFATGYGHSVLPERHAGAIMIKKPYGQRDLESALARVQAHPSLPS